MGIKLNLAYNNHGSRDVFIKIRIGLLCIFNIFGLNISFKYVFKFLGMECICLDGYDMHECVV